jgi:prephenate dehydrogenase
MGVGLLGGSIGLGLKSAGTDCKITGYGHRAATLQSALQIGAIDIAADNAAQAVAEADLVILCTPVGIFPSLIEHLRDKLRPGCILTDVGSTKRSIVRLAAEFLPSSVHFIGSHPMAGSEKRGVEYARADLFRNARCILTPTATTDQAVIDAVGGFWKILGMRLTILSPDYHDQLLADVSHLPHTLAAALVAMQEDAALSLSGKGFLDTTRIAGGDGPLWRDILLDNADNMRASLARLRQTLSHLESLLEPSHGDELAQWLTAAAARREHWLQHKLRDVTPD